MIEAGLWKNRVRKTEPIHGWRPRRSGFGKLVQWDTSEHDWLEGRVPVRCGIDVCGAAARGNASAEGYGAS
jgi:hypothetical protein